MSNENAENISYMDREEVHKARFENHFRIKPFNGNFTEYTENATIHGIKYLGEKRRSCGEKIYWILIFTCCFTFLGIFIRGIVVKWQMQAVILVEDDVPTRIYKIPFPAVTICPQIKVKNSKFPLDEYLEKIYRGELKKINDLDKEKVEVAYQICNEYSKKMFRPSEMGLGKYLNTSHIPILHELSPTLNETLLSAEYNVNFLFEKATFSEILTNEGVCFTFNVPQDIIRQDEIQNNYQYNSLNQKAMNWDADEGYNIKADSSNLVFPIFIIGAGKDFGMRLHLSSLKTDITSLCQPLKNIAFKIVLHSPTVYPTTYEDYIFVEYETVTNIAVTPKLIKTPENLRDYSSGKRQCYFKEERRLKYFPYYNKVNCKLECLANFTRDSLNCVHFSLPMELGTPICGPKSYNNFQMYHHVEALESLEHLLDDKLFEHLKPGFINKTLLMKHKKCNCLPECNSVEYTFKTQAEQTIFGKLNVIFNNDTNTTLSHQNTVVNIFFNSDRVVGMTRSKLVVVKVFVSRFGS